MKSSNDKDFAELSGDGVIRLKSTCLLSDALKLSRQVLGGVRLHSEPDKANEQETHNELFTGVPGTIPAFLEILWKICLCV